MNTTKPEASILSPDQSMATCFYSLVEPAKDQKKQQETVLATEFLKHVVYLTPLASRMMAPRYKYKISPGQIVH